MTPAVEARWAAHESVQAKDWVGHLVASVVGLSAESDRARIKAILCAWRKNGALTVEHRPDKNGDKRPFMIGAVRKVRAVRRGPASSRVRTTRNPYLYGGGVRVRVRLGCGHVRGVVVEHRCASLVTLLREVNPNATSRASIRKRAENCRFLVDSIGSSTSIVWVIVG
jgi:hypothetical protein